jgi:hypothetical protein
MKSRFNRIKNPYQTTCTNMGSVVDDKRETWVNIDKINGSHPLNWK